jgi:hypothetical protein
MHYGVVRHSTIHAIVQHVIVHDMHAIIKFVSGSTQLVSEGHTFCYRHSLLRGAATRTCC